VRIGALFEPLHDPVDDVDHHQVFLVRGDHLLVRDTADGGAQSLSMVDAREIIGRHPLIVLGRYRRTLYWASGLDDDLPVPDGHRLEGLRALHGHLDDVEWNIGGRARLLWDWHTDNKFCGRCGGPMERSEGDRSMRCPIDGHTAYPRLSPAVIVLVEREDGRALLGRSGRWDDAMYSTLAGFVEAGETLEETVRREVREEVGIEVDQVDYFGSQPWPFPNSLMVGFNACWAGGEIQVDGDEIVDAQWFAHDELPLVSPKLSIARALIAAWTDRFSQLLRAP
jgi:NAD+ diphosphatase